jgi:isopentenyl-diphosphate delta-isomerase
MMKEYIVLLDQKGEPIGNAEKLAAHHANTPLHLAFSCYIFNSVGELLVTRRALTKKVWPGVWTNSLCGHPAPDESFLDAIRRRAEYELGISVRDIKEILPDYRYKTPPCNGIIENEKCPVFFARLDGSKVNPNPEEVESFQWMAWDDYAKATTDDANAFSWWCKDQLRQLKKWI